MSFQVKGHVFACEKKYEGLKRIKYGPSKQSICQSEEDMSPKEEYMVLSKGKFPKNEKKIMFFFVKTVVSSAEEFAIKWKKTSHFAKKVCPPSEQMSNLKIFCPCLSCVIHMRRQIFIYRNVPAMTVIL